MESEVEAASLVDLVKLLRELHERQKIETGQFLRDVRSTYKGIWLAKNRALKLAEKR